MAIARFVPTPARPHRQPRSNLPHQLTTFVGRETQIEEVEALLDRSRLVTLTGAGGIGKTRLALAVAAGSVDAYEGGVWLVELAKFTNPKHIQRAMLDALGFSGPSRRRAQETLINLIESRAMLCVLDNCEHLVDPVAALVDSLLRHCPGLRVLATSRDILGVGGEVTWRVPSMTMPDDHGYQTIDELTACETVRLFAERAQAACPDFQVTHVNASSVARICQRVDGIPLAVELAAARTRSMSTSEIDEHLADQFPLLTGGPRVAVPRQRTLRATFDWSHDLLDEAERRVFRRVSVFSGGFRSDAAQAVCASDPDGTVERSVAESLAHLVDKSLVISHGETDPPGRYRLLEPIRQYAGDRLNDAGEFDETHERHARFFLRLGEQASEGLLGAAQSTWMARVVAELDNLRAAFGWAMTHDATGALRLAVALERFWYDNSPAEGREWVLKALASYPDRDELRAHALVDAAYWGRHRARCGEARGFGHESLAIAHELGSDVYAARALEALAEVEITEHAEGWAVRNRSLLEQAAPHVDAISDLDAVGLFLNGWADSLHEAGDLIGARAKLHDALALARDRNDQFWIECLLLSLADIEWDSGDMTTAEDHLNDVLDLARRRGSRTSAAHALDRLSRLAVPQQPERYFRLQSASKSLFELAGIAEVDDAEPSPETPDASQPPGDGAQPILRPATAGMSLTETIQFGLGQTGHPEPPRPSGSRRVSRLVDGDSALIREGEFWSVTYEGAVVRLRDSKGVRILARLLAEPGRRWSALDLERLGAPAAEPLAYAVASGDAGELLDGEARRSYRARTAELRAAIESAEAVGSGDQTGRLREELDFITHELSRAFGLGGRPRRAGSIVERARLNVVRAVRSAIRRISAADAELGAHLAATIHTGTTCVYTPDPRVPIAWRVMGGEAPRG
jgi:non-specific serine/threonine protein kinase